MSIFHQDIENTVEESFLHPDSPLMKEWVYNAISFASTIRPHIEINKDIFEFQDVWANPILIDGIGIRSYIHYIRGIIGGYTLTCKSKSGRFELYDDTFILGASSKVTFMDVGDVHDIEVQAPILTVQNAKCVRNSNLKACRDIKCYDMLTYFENTSFTRGAKLSYYIDILATDNPLISAISRDICNPSLNTVQSGRYTHFGKAYQFDLHQLFGIPSDLGMVYIRCLSFGGDIYEVHCLPTTVQTYGKDPKCTTKDGYLIQYSKA